jgi:hypothetical protein
MKKLTKQFCKSAVISLILASLALPFLAAPEKAKAGGLLESISSLMEKVPLPDDLALEEDGNITFGSWFKTCPFLQDCDCNNRKCQEECVKKEVCNKDQDCKANEKCVEGQCYPKEECQTINLNVGECRMRKNKQGQNTCYRCFNPFNNLQIGQGSQTALIDSQTKRLKVPVGNVPDICELKIIEKDVTLSQEERIAKSRACLQLDSLGRNAGQSVFYAKQLYNATDPLSSCLFLRTCKSSCYLRFGSVSYNISLMDVAELLVPAGWLAWVKKIYNIIQVLKEINGIYNLAKDFIAAATSLFNNVLSVVNNAKALYDALENLGVRWYDALGPASSLIAGEDRVEAGYSGLKKILRDFAGGLEGFTLAKSETISTIETASQEANQNVKEKIKQEKELEFLFKEDSPKRQTLNSILNDYFLRFQSFNERFDNLIKGAFLLKARRYNKKYSTCSYQPLGPMNIGDQCKNCIDCLNNPASDGCKNVTREYPNFCNRGGNLSGLFNICDPLFSVKGENLSRGLIEEEYKRFFSTDNQNKPTVLDVNALNSSGLEMVLERHKGEPGNTENVSSTVYFNTENGRERHVILCETPNRVRPAPIIGQIQTWFELYQRAASRAMHLKDNLQAAALAIDKYNPSAPNIDVIQEMEAWIKDSQTVITQVDKAIEAVLGADKQLNDAWQGQCENVFKDCHQLYCTNQEWACYGDKYWRHYGWYAGGIINKGDPIPKGICELSPFDNSIKNEAYELDIMQDNWQNKINLLEQMKADIAWLNQNWSWCLTRDVNNPGSIFQCLSPNASSMSLRVSQFQEAIKSPINNFVQKITGYQSEAGRKAQSAWDKYTSLNCPNFSFNNCANNCSDNRSWCRQAPCNRVCKDRCEDQYTTCRNNCRTKRDDCDKYLKEYNKWSDALTELDRLILAAGFKEQQQTLNQELDNLIKKFDWILDFLKAPQDSQSELGLARDFAQTVLNLIMKSQEALAAFQKAQAAIDGIFAAAQNLRGNVSNNNSIPRETKNNILADLDNLVRTDLKDLQAGFSKDISSILGQDYKCNEADKGFLSKIKCFEEELGKSFQQIYNFFVDGAKLEDFISQLNGAAENVLLAMVMSLEPEFRTEPLQLREDVAQQAEANLQAAKNGQETQPITFFDANAQNGSWDKYNKQLLANPLTALEGAFGVIRQSIGQLRSILDVVEKALQEFVGDGRFAQNYQQPMQKLKQKVDAIERLVFGDEKARLACSSLEPIFNQQPKDLQKACGELTGDLIADAELNNLCDSLSKAGVSGPGDITAKLTQLAKEEQTDDNKKYQDQLKALQCLDCQCQGQACSCSRNRRACQFVTEAAFVNFAKQCSNLADQQQLLEACGQFGGLQKALTGQCGNDKSCSDLKTSLDGLCSAPFSLQCQGNVLPNLLADTQDMADLRLQAQEVCNSKVTDIKTNLDKVMKVFSILMGIRSGTLVYQGVKAMPDQASKVFNAAQQLKSAFTSIGDNFSKAWNKKPPVTQPKSGFSVEPMACQSEPAQSYSTFTDTYHQGPKGGPVCPDAGNLFGLLDSQFSLVRQNLQQIDLERKNVVKVKFGPLSINLLKNAPVVFASVNDVYQQAWRLKQEVQLMWTFGTAVEFAQKNCNCGQSYCKICLYAKDGKCLVPLCASGAPLTFEPIEQPFCYVVYTMRVPLKMMAERVERVIGAIK